MKEGTSKRVEGVECGRSGVMSGGTDDSRYCQDPSGSPGVTWEQAKQGERGEEEEEEEGSLLLCSSTVCVRTQQLQAQLSLSWPCSGSPRRPGESPPPQLQPRKDASSLWRNGGVQPTH
ncbi:hypothetical protein Q5P01_026170 [Channa striata]|uniref:Uncharacterized protein n=1 Tax=Channa striata TaxID=64152 RepID=A0AA88LNL5_CHASR|nr:hypothetical protein Q5P01_026170 [Channa striata]